MKARTRISIALAALGLLAAAAGPATAANHRHSKHHLARASLAPLRPPAEIGDWGVIPPLDGPNSAIDGGATGDGPADDEECERYADAINEAQAEMNEDLDLGAGWQRSPTISTRSPT